MSVLDMVAVILLAGIMLVGAAAGQPSHWGFTRSDVGLGVITGGDLLAGDMGMMPGPLNEIYAYGLGGRYGLGLGGDFGRKPPRYGHRMMVTADLGLRGELAEVMVMNGPGNLGPGMYGVTFRNWRGFALLGNESHVLRMSVENVILVDPLEVRRLLSTNTTLEEIRARLGENDEAATRGYMRLGQEIYRLVNINETLVDDGSVLVADVAEAQFSRMTGDQKIDPADEAEIVGHIEVTASKYENEVIEGILTMDGGQYGGVYKVLLDSQIPEGHMMGGRGQPFHAEVMCV